MDILPYAGKKGARTLNTGTTAESSSAIAADRPMASGVKSQGPLGSVSADAVDRALSAGQSPAEAARATFDKPRAANYRPEKSILALDSLLEVHGAAPMRDTLKGPALEVHQARQEFFSVAESLLSGSMTDPRVVTDNLAAALGQYNATLARAVEEAKMGVESAVVIPGSRANVRDARISVLKSRLDDANSLISDAKRERDSASLVLRSARMELDRQEAEIEVLEDAGDNAGARELMGKLPNIRGRVTESEARLREAEKRYGEIHGERSRLSGIIINETGDVYSDPSTNVTTALAPFVPPALPPNAPAPYSQQPLEDRLAGATNGSTSSSGNWVKWAALAGAAVVGYSLLTGSKEKSETPSASPRSKKPTRPVEIESLED